MNKPIIHGDVGIIPTNELPKGLKKLKHEPNFVLRHGETGHKHVITSEPQDIDIYLDEKTGFHVLNIKNPVQISHEEHKTLIIEPGIFIEKAEQEYNPFEKQLRQVID